MMPARLLVVDDIVENRDLLSRRLVRAGYEVGSAADGQQALDMISNDSFDLILLDVMMPGIDGLTVLTTLRATYSSSDLPVIMVTARSETDQIVAALEKGANDYVVKPINFPVVLARVRTHLSVKESGDKIKLLASKLEERNEFIRKTFGRYVSSQIVETVLDQPQGLGFDGVRRQVSILIADIRGFTLLAESLAPEEIVKLLNNYLESMIEIIEKYGGTVAEIVGDGVLAFFGAPIADADHATHAVACAFEMQQAMNLVNATNRSAGMPELQMGVAVNSGEGVVGNIGSQTRTKYAVVGGVVNLASRIEGNTAAGQIVISESTHAHVVDIVTTDEIRTIRPKGSRSPINIHQISAIGGKYNLKIDRPDTELVAFPEAISVNCTLVEGKHISEVSFRGGLVTLSLSGAELYAEIDLEIQGELRIQLDGASGQLFGRILEKTSRDNHFLVGFSSLSPDARDLVVALLGRAR